MQNSPKPQVEKAQLPVINSLRGIAAIMIMVHHVTVYVLPQISIYTYPVTPFFKKNYLWVDFFFMLSGFIACHVYRRLFSGHVSRKDFISFITSRFARLYPLHFIILMLFVAVEVIYMYLYSASGGAVHGHQLPVPFSNEYSGMKLLLNLVMLNALLRWGTWNGPSWAMSAIWIMAFIVPFLIHVSVKVKLAGHIVISAVCVLILVFLNHKYGTLDIMAAGGLIRCLAETVMGIACYNLYRGLPANRWLADGSMFGVCLLLAFITMVLPVNHSLTACVFFVLILMGAYQGHDSIFSRPWLLVLGDLSFAIYLIHWLPFQILDKAALMTTGSKFNSIESPLLIALVIVPVMISVVLVSLTVYRKVETPLRHLIKAKSVNALNGAEPGV